jgi:hypothetical protein
MANFMAIFSMFLSIVKMIPQAVDALEAVLPAAGQGQAKLALLKGAIVQALAVETSLQPLFETVWMMVTPVIAGYVAAKKVA